MVPAAIAMRSARRARLRIGLTSTAVRFTSDRPLVVFARTASRGVSIPRGMMSPRPPLRDGAARHRLERTRLLRGALVNVNDESHQHQQCSHIVEHVTDCHRAPPERARKPHRQARDQKDDGAPYNRPEVKFLAAVEESDIRWFEQLFIRYVG